MRSELVLTPATDAYTYPAADIMSLPLGTSALRSSADLPPSLTGSELAVSDFAFARGKDGSLYLAGGQSAGGDVVSLKTIGKWTTSKGWVSQATSGDVPAGRVGASLVAHPSLDLLILHGGSVNNAATPTVSFLNTTSWTWSTPSNLQPPASNAAAYHSAIMTPQGVMITAFGLGSTGSPSSSVFYLDMRGTSPNGWSWKSYWNKDMLEASSATFTDNTTKTNTSTGIATPQGSDNGISAKKTTSIVVPTVIAALILIPLAIYFIRRKLRMDKKRRMARHFSFSSQEDEGDFRGAINQYHSPGRKTKTQFGFGKDANEREGNMFSDMIGAFRRMSRRSSIGSVDMTGPKEMQQVKNGRVSRLDERTMNWEEIDFGLGRLDANRQSSAPAPPLPAGTAADPFADPAPLIRFDSNSDVGTPLNDGQHPLIPELNVLPPTVPPTPAGGMLEPSFMPSGTDGLDWNMLAQEMQVRPAFRSISPTSTLRSHAHTHTSPLVRAVEHELPYLRSVSPSPVYSEQGAPAPGNDRLPKADSFRSSGPPRIPSIDFEYGGVSPLEPRSQRSSQLYQPGNRAVSQPIGRQLTGSVGRRGSAPFVDEPPRSQSPKTPEMVPTARRTSTPALFSSPGSPGTFGSRSPKSPTTAKEKRESAMSKLRVMNVTDSDSLESQ